MKHDEILKYTQMIREISTWEKWTSQFLVKSGLNDGLAASEASFVFLVQSFVGVDGGHIQRSHKQMNQTDQGFESHEGSGRIDDQIEKTHFDDGSWI